MKIKDLKNNIDLLDYVRDQGENVERVGENTYWLNPCPVCGQYGHFTIFANTNTYHSFSGCCEGKSNLDYLMVVEGLSKNEAIEKLKNMSKGDGSVVSEVETIVEGNEIDREDISNILEEAKQNDCDYFQKRGLSEDIIQKYQLGYLPDGCKYGKDFKYVLPVSNDHVIVRTDIDGKKDKYRNIGSTEIFNIKYLEDPALTDNEIFLAEGVFDALSLETNGKPAVALNSTSMAGKLIEVLKNNKSILQDKYFILAFDNDEMGKKISKKIKESIEENDLYCEELDLNNYKDVNQFFTEDPELFKQELKELPLKGTAYDYLANDFKVEQLKRKDEKLITTGFAKFDEVLGGGMYSGLYVLGSITSLGKSAIALQIADRIAEQSIDVIFFSLEMGRYEMVCRSLARVLYEKSGCDIFTTGDILKAKFTNNEITPTKPFYDALDWYSENIAKYITFIEGDFSVGVTRLKNIIQKQISKTNKKPVIFVDYIQVLKPDNPKYSDKQNIDYSIVELKRVSRDLDLPVFVISSFNRDAYTEEVSFKSFKESGSIEYTADLVLGLQLRKDKDENIDEIKMLDPRPLELVILKNRRGRSYEKLNLDYRARLNFFEES